MGNISNITYFALNDDKKICAIRWPVHTSTTAIRMEPAIPIIAKFIM